LHRIGLDLIQKEEQELTSKALNGLSKIRGLKIFGISDPASTSFAYKGGVIVFNLKSMMAHQVAKELALRRGIGVRSGCHCAHILVKHLMYKSKLIITRKVQELKYITNLNVYILTI
jgi:selenocysteine lyase/cysteine desulfurase